MQQEWDLTLLSSLHQHIIGKNIDLEKAEMDFAKALPCAVKLPNDASPNGDVLIDDIFFTFLLHHIE